MQYQFKHAWFFSVKLHPKKASGCDIRQCEETKTLKLKGFRVRWTPVRYNKLKAHAKKKKKVDTVCVH